MVNKAAKKVASKTAKKMSKKAAPRMTAANFVKSQNIKSWVETFKFDQEPQVTDEVQGFVFYIGDGQIETLAEIISESALSWQISSLLHQIENKDLFHYVGEQGPVWILNPKAKKTVGHDGLIDEAIYTWSRDAFGSMLSSIKNQNIETLSVHFIGTSEVQEIGALIGLDLAAYNYRQFADDKELLGLPSVYVTKDDEDMIPELIDEAVVNAAAVNFARHLVNLPPNLLDPKSFADLALEKLKSAKSMTVTVWDEKKLAAENMNLHLAVGQGAENTARMVHMKYRPSKKSSLKPVAIVGKGITFDTGGLDIKPSAAMRLMKKDMGGAASVLALAIWATESNYPAPLDFYLALAENSVDGKSFRPGDIIIARNGMSVEIDNTDAEGRLVLADVLHVAATKTGQDEPELVIDVATLTGAIKVGLGCDIAGLFANDDELAYAITTAGQRAGDLNWRMPLFEKYWADMSSSFADCKNSGPGFGGAITAALFLQKFVAGKKWAHLDVYAWNDKAQGALFGAGGSGQPVQCLIEFLDARLANS